MTLHEHPTTLLAPSAAARRRRWDHIDVRRLDAGHAYSQGSLALTFPLASGLGAEPLPPALSLVGAGPQPEPTVPDPNIWAARFLQAVVEVVASDRPLAQLVRWTDPSVFGDISRRRRTVAERNAGQVRSGRHQIATVHVSRPDVASAEVAARVITGSRSRAIAARLDFQRDRWLCTALDFG